jgi:hypothetical protein
MIRKNIYIKIKREQETVKIIFKKEQETVGFSLNVLRLNLLVPPPTSTAKPRASSHTKGTLGGYVFFRGIFVMVVNSIASSTVYFSADELGKSPVQLGNGCDI